MTVKRLKSLAVTYQETGLGKNPGDWTGQELVRIDIDKSVVNDFYESGKLNLPTGSESGVNNNWIPGGETSGGIAEAILSDCPTSNIDRVGSTTAINGVPTEQLNNLYNSLGRDSECLRFIHCIPYTSTARGFYKGSL